MFHRVIAAVVFLLLAAVPTPRAQHAANVRSVVSRADLIRKAPVVSREDGIPVGNGRMAGIVWTTRSALRLQIDRVGDHMRRAVFVDIELSGPGAEVFTAGGTTQHLSVYEGLLDMSGAGINARLLAWPERDVIAIEVDDRRPLPQPIEIKLARDHSAESQLSARGGRITSMQRFQEGAHHSRSAVAIALLGRRTFTRFTNDTELRIVSPAERGRIVILIASAKTVDFDEDVVASAVSSLDAAAVKSFDDLAGDGAEWWHAFWQRATLGRNSPDASAESLAEHHYKLYLTASVGARW